MGPTLTVSENGDLSFIRAAIGELEEAKTYIGVPEEDTRRKQQFIGSMERTAVTNAGLLYIHTNGSQKHNIPPRPVIEPSIEANHEKIEEGLNQVASLTLDGKKQEAKKQLKAVGTFAANGAKDWFTDPRNGWPQNQPRTIERKISKLRSKKKRRQIMNMVLYIKAQQEAKGEKLMPRYGTWVALDAANTPLIDTGELRRSITHLENL